MHQLNFKIEGEFDGITLEKFLRNNKGMSSRTLKTLKHTEGGLKRNGEHIRSIDIIRTGDVITLTFFDEPQLIPSPDIPIDIVYEDDDFILCNKNGYMPTHPSLAHRDDSLANAVSAYLAKSGHIQTVRIINRLDKGTSGLVLIAKHQLAACAVSGKINKTYFALVEGELHGKGVIDKPIRREEPDGKRRIVADDGERAVTEYEAVESHNGTTLLKLNLITGRTHQIRVHFSYIGHPLLGDKMYNPTANEEIDRQALHCGIIEWENPVRDKKKRCFAEFPEDILKPLKDLGYSFSIKGNNYDEEND